MQRVTWDLRWAGSDKIKNAKIDTGDPEVGPLVVPGTYTVKLTVDGKSASVPLAVKADPRSQASQADLEAQLAFGLEVRDQITRLTHGVNQLRSVKEQLQARRTALAGTAKAAALLKDADAASARVDAFEAEIHNPRAEIVYDILAMKGGAKLYSRLSPLLDWSTDGDGVPTAGMRQVLADQKHELDQWDGRIRQFIATDVAALNSQASQLGIAFVTVP